MTPHSLTDADASLTARLSRTLRPIPDYPKPGIVFQDITPVLRDGPLFRQVVEALAAPFRGPGVTHVVGIEARGFILGGAVAATLGAGFVPVRKPGKLPWERVTESYELEYGADALECHRDALERGSRAVIVDDVLATGGTAAAAGRLARGLGAEVIGWSFLLEIAALEGRRRLAGAPSPALLSV
ncbi:MAG: adenine phosphoribosyltransferase [Gemmatimonadales bacterium]|nr:adenine phosphoribosyltransferase [Gemmatimonadales bacterium]